MSRPVTFLLIAVLFIAGCSSTKLAYRYADWGIVWWVDDYIPMTDAQETRLAQDIETLQQWHCTTELPRYSEWLTLLKQDVHAGKFEESTVTFHQEQLFSFFTPLMDRAKPAATTLLSSLSDEQVRELAENMADSQQELEDKYLSDSPEDSQAARAERTAERVERWLGPLNETQLKTVRAWSDAPGEQTAVWLEGRRNWQQAFLESLEERNQANFDGQISYLIDNNAEVRGARYQQMMDDSRASMARLMSGLLKQADDQQLDHLLDRAAGLRGDFDTLHTTACTGEPSTQGVAQAN